ncbi:hypothetical protein HY638_05520 [Candidatus Woesearchaeota archaeon]|nr:hypothetical protein [Candidatus Woesearchaeota archaeon]
MKTTLNKTQFGLALGTLFGALHLLWVISVGGKIAQGLVDYWHGVHFLTEVHTIGAFSIGPAIIGVIIAFISGYVLGWVFAALVNWYGKKV